jgi:hypothetical protein
LFLISEVEKIEHSLLRFRQPEALLDTVPKEEMGDYVPVNKLLAFQYPPCRLVLGKQALGYVGMGQDAGVAELVATQGCLGGKIGRREPPLSQYFRPVAVEAIDVEAAADALQNSVSDQHMDRFIE